ncbi:hypothetical protein NIES2100_14700 [Calothrix sp. NIES-2100]|nr:hypothetical protein NIES2100_14700 [Calothrix sp. NIES-2100]
MRILTTINYVMQIHQPEYLIRLNSDHSDESSDRDTQEYGDFFDQQLDRHYIARRTLEFIRNLQINYEL